MVTHETQIIEEGKVAVVTSHDFAENNRYIATITKDQRGNFHVTNKFVSPGRVTGADTNHEYEERDLTFEEVIEEMREANEDSLKKFSEMAGGDL